MRSFKRFMLTKTNGEKLTESEKVINVFIAVVLVITLIASI